MAILNSKVSFILFLASKLNKIVENLCREDQISLFSISKNHDIIKQIEFGLFSFLASRLVISYYRQLIISVQLFVYHHVYKRKQGKGNNTQINI